MYLDGANGVGADKIKILSEKLNNQYNKQTSKLNIHLFNEAKEKDDILNYLVYI